VVHGAAGGTGHFHPAVRTRCFHERRAPFHDPELIDAALQRRIAARQKSFRIAARMTQVIDFYANCLLSYIRHMSWHAALQRLA
jgi:hypothetical protein